jgi:threonine synthase
MEEGFTPLIPFSYKDFRGISLKLDYLCPTGSFKDRGVSVLVSKTKELGISEYLGESSGNAGASLAAYTARAGIECRMYCPATTSEGKLVQMKAYGAQVTKIPGTRADTTAAVQEEAKRCSEGATGCYYSPQTWNPFFLEGLKTLGFEICEQLGWKAPDEKHPRLIGIQAEAIAPIYEAFSRKAVEVDEVPRNETMAEGIACVRPNRGKEILEIARVTEGCFEIVSEKEIIEGWRELNRQGIYVEPTSAVVVKAIDRLAQKGLVNPRERIVLILTGSGLKATEKLGGYVNA